MKVRLIDARTGKETSVEQIENEVTQLQDDIQGWYAGPVNDTGLLNILLNRRDTLNDVLDMLIEAPNEHRSQRNSNKISITKLLSKRK